MRISISRVRWEMFDPDQQDKIKEITMNYSTDMGYDHNYEYYWIMFTDEQHLLAELAGLSSALSFRP